MSEQIATSAPTEGVALVVIGPSGAGKSSVAETIAQTFGWVRLSSGDLMRALLDDPTEVGDHVRAMAAQDLPPDGIAQSATLAAMLRVPVSTGVVLDGFPRSREQAEALQLALADARRRLVAVVAIEVDEDVSLARVARRYICPECHLITSDAERGCPACGGAVTRRAGGDGAPSSVLRRRSRYFADIPPVYEFYRARGLLSCVDGTPPQADVVDVVARHVTHRLEEGMTTSSVGPLGAHPDAIAALALIREPQSGIYLREALRAVADLGTPAEIDAVLVGSTFVLAKPEAVVGRRLRRIGDFLLEHGFEVVGLVPVELDRIRTRTLWKDHLDRGPLPVGQLLDLLGSGAPGIIFLVRTGRDVTVEPAASRIRKLKGRAVTTATDGTLRSRLDVTTPSLNFVHTPDDQARVFSELALLLPQADLLEGLARLKDGPAIDAAGIAELLDALEGGTPPHALDVDQALERLARLNSVLATHVGAGLDPGTSVASSDRERVIDHVAREGRLSVWDRATLVAHLIGDSRITFGRVSPKELAEVPAMHQGHTRSVPARNVSTVEAEL